MGFVHPLNPPPAGEVKKEAAQKEQPLYHDAHTG